MDLSNYQLVVAPAIQLVNPERARHFERTAKHARFIFGPRTGFRDMNGKVHPGGQPGPLAALLGCKLLDFDAMPSLVHAQAAGHRIETWAEAYRPTTGSHVVAYDDGPLAGMSAVVRNGNCLTIGAWSPSLIDELISIELRAIGITPMRLPDGLRRVSLGERTIWLNFNQTPMLSPTGVSLDPVSWRIEPTRKD